MKATKQKILDAALKLFNQNGIVNVRLQHIADDAVVSVGNLAYPSIASAHQQHIASQIGQLRTILDFNASRGALIVEPMEGVFEKLAQQIWMTLDFWLTQQAVRVNTEVNEKEYRMAVWSLLIPYFTDQGKREYEQMLEMPYDFYF